MSIAVSAVIVPSRRLRWLLAAGCASLAGAAFALGWLLPARFAWDGAVACVPLCAALVTGWSCLVYPAAATARRIDVSGVGQIRLTVQEGMTTLATTMTLLPGATVWPACMLLRLQSEQGVVRPLLLLPDSVSGDAYRALAVAMRALTDGAGAQAANGAGTTSSPGRTPPKYTLNLLQEANS